MPATRQGQTAAADERAVAWALGHVAEPPYSPADIGKLLDRPRQTVWRWLNDQADQTEAAYDDARADGTLPALVDRTLADDDTDGKVEKPPPVAPVFAAVADVYRDILEVVWRYGVGFEDAAVMCHVPRVRAIEFMRQAAEELDAGQQSRGALIWHLVDQVRAWRGAQLLQRVDAGKSGWQAKHVSLRALHGDLLERAAATIETTVDLEDASNAELFAHASGEIA